MQYGCVFLYSTDCDETELSGEFHDLLSSKMDINISLNVVICLDNK